MSIQSGLGARGHAPKAQQALPLLRQELLLHRGPSQSDGSPTWTLEDPGRGAFFRIGWAEAEMLASWSLGNAQAVVEDVGRRTTLTIDLEDVQAFAQFLQQQSLIQVHGQEALAQLQKMAQQRQTRWYQQLLHHYLFIRIPLWRPDDFLTRTMPIVQRLFLNAQFLWLTLFAGVLGLILALRQWDAFVHTFPYFFTLEGAALAGLTLVLAKVVHELGHAYVCKYFGCRVSTMGVALMVLWPVLYTDTSGAWRLASRRQRMLIGAAGMLSETVLAAWATLAWSFLSDGMLRSAMFVLATTTWILTLAVNLNPLMRFDGYFLLSDALAVPNLQQRSFALARWRLREALFGLGEPCPEWFEPWRERVLTIYAWCVWVYRFFLFLGIALLVYHMAFKVLGIFLFMVEIVAFILKPLCNELRQWFKRRQQFRWNRHTLISLSVLVVLILGLFFPWRTSIHAPALIRATQQFHLYAPVGAQLSMFSIVPGQHVAKGELLAAMNAPALRHEMENVQRRLAVLQWQSAFHPLASEVRDQAPVAQQELSAVRTRAAVLQRQLSQLSVAAPFDGVVADIAQPLREGEWLAAGEWLATIATPDAQLVEAYVSEADVTSLSVNAHAVFYPQDMGRGGVEAQVVSIAHVGSNDLSLVPELASVHGGSIAASQDANHRLIPEQAVYRVLLRPLKAESAPVDHSVQPVQIGSVRIEGPARSWAVSLWRRALSVLIRETGF